MNCSHDPLRSLTSNSKTWIKSTQISTPSCWILFPEERLRSLVTSYLWFSIKIPINYRIYWWINNQATLSKGENGVQLIFHVLTSNFLMFFKKTENCCLCFILNFVSAEFRDNQTVRRHSLRPVSCWPLTGLDWLGDLPHHVHCGSTGHHPLSPPGKYTHT